MARFYGTVQGNRGEASRMGTPDSGLVSRTNGWDAGVRVEAWADGEEDVFDIFQTGGSNGGEVRQIARIRGGKVEILADAQVST